MTINTDPQYNKRDARDFCTNHNLMAKKRKLYLYKRSGGGGGYSGGGSQEVAKGENVASDETTITAATPMTSSRTTKITTNKTTETTITSQQQRLSATTTTSLTSTATTLNVTFPSNLLSNNTTNCLRGSFDRKSNSEEEAEEEVLQQWRQNHHQYHKHHQQKSRHPQQHSHHCNCSFSKVYDETVVRYPKALCQDLRESATLNFLTTNQQQQQLFFPEDYHQQHQTQQHQHHHRNHLHQQQQQPQTSCSTSYSSCTNKNCQCNRQCCCKPTTTPTETIGTQRPWCPSMNSSYYTLRNSRSSSSSSSSGSADVVDSQVVSIMHDENDDNAQRYVLQQQQRQSINSTTTFPYSNATTTTTCMIKNEDENNPNPSNIRCCFHNRISSRKPTLEAKEIEEQLDLTGNVELNLKANPSFFFFFSSSSYSSFNSNIENQPCSRRRRESCCFGPNRHYFSQKIEIFFMILKLLLTLIPRISSITANQEYQRRSSFLHKRQQPLNPNNREENFRNSKIYTVSRRISLPMSNLLMSLSLISLFFLATSSSAAASQIIPPSTSPMHTSSLDASIKAFTERPRNAEFASPRTEIRLGRKETVCKSLDIRNSPLQLRQLANCTVIEGFLLITLINTRHEIPFNETFPLLTEVTDFVFVYQVSYLRSLSQIFPNLSIIRGRMSFEGYAFLVISNSHLEDLGLSKLSMIGSGVRIEKNKMLCFVHTIDWSQIVASNTTEVYIQSNRAVIECPSCPGVLDNSPSDKGCKLHQGRHNCWNSKVCQKICPARCRHNCYDENTCCNERCLGGCSPDNVNECLVCRKYSHNHTTCVDSCPEGLLYFMDRRCLTTEECTAIGSIFENNKPIPLIAFQGNCTIKCPENFNKENNTCVPCNGECIKKCEGGEIDGATRALDYSGCKYIEGNLEINIKRASQVNSALVDGLSSIRTISGYLQIQGTVGLLNLKFLKNLKTIKGNDLYQGNYSLYVLDNTDLEYLWDKTQNVSIENGKVYFHFNPKLCVSTIKDLLLPTLNQKDFDVTEVSLDSNGLRGSCNSTTLLLRIYGVNFDFAFVEITNPIKYEDERTFIGYQFFHMEDPYRNATKYTYRPCDDDWNVSPPVKDVHHIFHNLKPYTQYAVYVKTMTISTERRSGQSDIYYFTTLSAKPSMVRNLRLYANSSSVIIMKWSPPADPNGKIVKYRIRAIYEAPVTQLESRNYCKDPLKVAIIEDIIPKTTITEVPKETPDCKCPKGGKAPIYPDENEIHANMEIENALQNFIYVKRENTTSKSKSSNGGNMTTELNRSRRDVIETLESKDSFMLRHIRQAPMFANDAAHVAHKNTNDTQVTNEIRMDPSNSYYEVFSTSVNATTFEFTFKQLKHFTYYKVEIEACREPEPNNKADDCSDTVIESKRTLKLDKVDRVESLWYRLEPTNSSRTNIRLFWKQPKRPNGAVVSYTIIYALKTHDEYEEKKCVNEGDFIKYDYEHNGYVLSDVHSGNYSIRIKTNTLAGEGLDSDTIHVPIPATSLAPSIIAGIVVGCIVLIGLITIIVYLLLRKHLATPNDLKIFPSMNQHYISLQYIPDEWEVARENVIQLSPLGQGSFGMVYEGILKSSEDDTPCAIKTVNENATDRERINFLNEACVMKQFDTYHVVRLLGVCSRGQPALVIMELMKNGDLKTYLRAHRPDDRDEVAAMNLMARGGMSSQPPPLSRIYQMAIEIADGMAYLAAKKFVHRDLAARNCMVAADLTVKIGDFGMTRDIYENDYYRKGTKGLLPVRWMSPESLRDGVYSSSSDVFSYGVVLWEMATLASQPYQGFSNDQVLRYVIDGGVMERPENCPDKLYMLMQKCWQHRATARPTFIEIIRYLYDLADPHFREVSFYNSPEGQTILEKELAERNQRSGDVFDDLDNDMEDVTTPLRLEDYNYKLNADNNSSIDHRGDSSMIMDDDAPHSPYSSTPDEQSRGSYNVSGILHPNRHLLNSAPSTSAGIRKLGSSTTSHQLTHPHTHPHHRDLYQPTRFKQQQQSRTHRNSEDADAYVQPDSFDPVNEDEVPKRDSDEQGYEMYDPSPNYSEHVPHGGAVGDPTGGVADDDEDDFGMQSTAGENLLQRPKGGKQKQPTIMPLSTSMPDDVIAQQAPSSLHPSTASAASSNASSKTTTAGGGKYPSLRAVADSARNRVMNMNKRIFHKRSGSNASHKSTSSNPTTAGAGGSISSLSRTGRGKSMSGQNLGTIESGGSGSTGSYTGHPRFYSTSSGTSDNTNYRRLDDSFGDTSMIGNETSRIRPRLHSASAFMMGSSQPTYRMLDESLNTTGTTSTLNTTAGGDNPNYEIMQPGGTPLLETETASTYVMMNEPQKKIADIGGGGAGVGGIMGGVMDIGDVANYQVMSPLIPGNSNSSTVLPRSGSTAAQLTRPILGERFNTLANIIKNNSTAAAAAPPPSSSTTAIAPPSAATASSSLNFDRHQNDTGVNNEVDAGSRTPTVDIPMDDLSLVRRSSSNSSSSNNDKTTTTKTDRSRSQSSSSGKSATNTASLSITPTQTSQHQQQQQQQQQPQTMTLIDTTAAAPLSSTFSRKEQWFKEQQQQQPTTATPISHPPPNGFVGRESSKNETHEY
ncbi:insulin-like receptor isoform X3 [Musca autumnalis]|uniref:insulin-like receptor isoform X3 n=1 Tax=Musca autumnalis TaxID=221902 RepID=UPI003CF0B45C